MKKRPDHAGRRGRAVRQGSAVLAGMLLATGPHAQVPEALSDDWYHVELLIFVREDASALGAERWEPLPELAYPERYRYLIDPERADRRLAESRAFASAIDERGIQRITVPAPVGLVDEVERPDARIDEPYVAEDPNQPSLVATDRDGAGGDADRAPQNARGALSARSDATARDAGADNLDGGESAAQEQEGPPRVLLALPEQLLPEAQLTFRDQARTLRRRGEQVLFHGHWWSRLPEDGKTLPLLLDRAVDMDTSAWPALQGSVHLYRSRYLHIDVDLWLNTMASYLPAGWQIPPPPLATPSLLSATLSGDTLDPWAPVPSTPGQSDEKTSYLAGEGDDEGLNEEGPVPAAPRPTREEALREAYPWRHAITHRQSRRMRSGETHYLDHPVIGVIVRLRPADGSLLPFAGDEALEFRERHQLPMEYLLLPEDD